MIVCDDLVLNTLPAELQLPVLNSKFTFLSFFQTNLDKIWNDDGAGEYLCTHKIVSGLVGKQPRKVDAPFRTETCCLGQVTVD